MNILEELLHRMWKPNIIGIIALSAASQDQPKNTEGNGKMSGNGMEFKLVEVAGNDWEGFANLIHIPTGLPVCLVRPEFVEDLRKLISRTPPSGELKECSHGLKRHYGCSDKPPNSGEEIGEDELITVIIDNIELKGGSINVPKAAKAIIEYYRKESK